MCYFSTLEIFEAKSLQKFQARNRQFWRFWASKTLHGSRVEFHPSAMKRFSPQSDEIKTLNVSRVESHPRDTKRFWNAHANHLISKGKSKRLRVEVICVEIFRVMCKISLHTPKTHRSSTMKNIVEL